MKVELFMFHAIDRGTKIQFSFLHVLLILYVSASVSPHSGGLAGLTAQPHLACAAFFRNFNVGEEYESNTLV
jgi:hypothetical protein